MRSEFQTFNDADMIETQTRAGISSSPLLQSSVVGGAITNLNGAQGSSITISGGGASGWAISASGAGSVLTFTVAVTNAATARTGLGVDDIATKKSNLTATIAPTVNDDSGDGYLPGSIWLGTVLNDAYICLDAAVGAAVWKIIT